MYLQGSDQDMRLVLEPGEAIGLTAVLWDIGAALKDTTGDPDCLAASASHEASWIDDDLGLPTWPSNARTRSTVAQFNGHGHRPFLSACRRTRSSSPTASCEFPAAQASFSK
jgi:hypothetical protein